MGLLPLLESEAREKLHRLLQNTVEQSKREFEKNSTFTAGHYESLFRLLFRLVAAKVLADRGHPGNWLMDDPQQAVQAVQDFYFRDTDSESETLHQETTWLANTDRSHGEHSGHILTHPQTQLVAWDNIRRAFHFQNLSGFPCIRLREYAGGSGDEKAARNSQHSAIHCGICRPPTSIRGVRA